MKTVFIPPSGKFIENPPLDMLQDWILNGTEAEWSAGSGDAGLEYRDAGFVSKLLLILDASYGFFVRYDVQDDETEYVINNGDPLGAKTTVYPGGEPWALPVAFFNSREQTLTIVEKFVESGQRAAGFAWEDMYRLAWDSDNV
jgi:hypothetical protein